MFGRPLFSLLHHVSRVVGSWKFDTEIQEKDRFVS